MKSILRKMKAVLTFAAGGAITMSLVIGLIAASEPRGLGMGSLRLAALELLMLAAGYALPLSILSKRSPAAKSTRADAIAGLVAPLTLVAISTLVQGVSVAGVTSLSLAAGVAIGLVQSVRIWLPSPPRKPTLEELELAADTALQKALAEAEARPDVIPIHRPERVHDDPSAQVA